MDPNDAKLSRGMALHQEGRLAEAEKLYREILQHSPKRFDALYLLGIAALAASKPQRAIDLIDRSIRQNPAFPPAWCNKGLALAQLSRHAEALTSFEKALSLDPAFAEAWYNRGISLHALARQQDAVASFDKALAIRPNDADAHNNRALSLISLGRHADALASLDKALSFNSNFAEAYTNRGNAFIGLKRPADALASFDRALAINPALAEAWCNRGEPLHDLNRPDDAEASFRQALVRKPDLAEAHFGLSLTLLALGRYDEGFRRHEWRKKRATPEGARTFPQPLWLGDCRIQGKTLFIHPELFLGDMINICRYAPLAEAKGAKVILAVQEPLRKSLQSLSPTLTIIGEHERPPRFDFHCPLMSLPLAFGTILETVPAAVPYLHPDRALSAAWKDKLGGQGFKIGVCWQGSAASVAMDRTFPLTRFGEISKIPNVRLISLQTGQGSDQLATLPEGMNVESYDEPGPTLRPFEDTAAMMTNLDLVITSDTAIAHLAGALARPTWIALKQVPDWRWGLQGDTTPWYPTVRLFRQPTSNDWTSVFNAIHAALAGAEGPSA
jgi:tetratricopeptide (TPR) repeat protein